MGGVYERMIRNIKDVLNAILLQHGEQLDEEALHTFMAEACAIVNGRPIYPNDLEDPESEVLTPSSILTKKTNVLLPLSSHFVREDLYCRKMWRRTQYMLDLFWSKFKSGYLNEKQRRLKWTAEVRNVRVGDIVLLKDDSLTRNDWPKGIIESVKLSDDHRVRSAKVRLASRHLNNKGVPYTKPTVLERPIAKMVLLIPAEE